MTKQILKNQVETLRKEGIPAKSTIQRYEYAVAAALGLIIGIVSSIWIWLSIFNNNESFPNCPQNGPNSIQVESFWLFLQFELVVDVERVHVIQIVSGNNP